MQASHGSSAWIGMAAAAGALGAIALSLVWKRAPRKRGNKKGDWLSSRARGLLEETTPAYIAEHIKRLGRFYHPIMCPHGYVCLSIAQNNISFDLLKDRISACRPHSSDTTGYNDPRGSSEIRSSIAALLGDHVMNRPLDPENIVCTSGATGVLNQLLFCICSEGDTVLIPAPYFTGFDGNLTDPRILVKPYAVHQPEGSDAFNINSCIAPSNLEAAYARVEHNGGRVGAILITSPHNPTGKLYSEGAVTECVLWAEKKGVQVVFDEVYALSVLSRHRRRTMNRLHPEVGETERMSIASEHMSEGGSPSFPPSPPSVHSGRGSGLALASGSEFFSVGCLFAPLKQHVHIVWGFSKDFGMAGWRVGVLYSENVEVTSAVRGLGHPSEASTDTLATIHHMLSDPAWLHKYIKDHKANLQAAYKSLCAELQSSNISYLAAEAGLFVLLDLRKHLASPEWSSENDLWRKILDYCNVNLTPGHAMHCTEPGWFRLCFAYHDPSTVRVAVGRIARLLDLSGRELDESIGHAHVMQAALLF